MRHFFINLAVFVAGVCAALALGEGLARLLHPLSTVEYRMEAGIGPVLVPHQRSRWVNEDYDVEILINGAGFHDVEHAIEKPERVYRILVLGDSYMEALQLPIEDGFTRQLEHKLGEWVTGTRAEIINLAVSGSGPAQYYRLLEQKGLAYEPDLVVMAVLPDNDFRDSLRALSGAMFKPYYGIRTDGTLEYIPPQLSEVGVALRPLLRGSALVHLIREAVVSGPVEGWLASVGLLAPAGGVSEDRTAAQIPLDWYVYVADPPEPWPDAYRVTLRMIKEASDLSERHGAGFLVMVVPSTQMVEQRWEEALRGYPDASFMKWDFQRPYREIAELGARSGFHVVSLLEPFRQDFLATRRSHSWPHHGHWNARGHQLAAEVMSAHLRAQRHRFGLESSEF